MASSYETAAVAAAKAIKAIRDGWAVQLELISLQAELTRERYLRLIKAGFTEEQALKLCTQELKI